MPRSGGSNATAATAATALLHTRLPLKPKASLNIPDIGEAREPILGAAVRLCATERTLQAPTSGQGRRQQTGQERLPKRGLQSCRAANSG